MVAACPARSRHRRAGRPRPSGAPARRTRARAFGRPTGHRNSHRVPPSRSLPPTSAHLCCSCGWQAGRPRASYLESGRSSAARRNTRRLFRGSPRGVGGGGGAGLGGGGTRKRRAREGGRERAGRATSIQSVLKMMSTITTMSNFGFWLSAMQNFRGCLLLSRQNSACTEHAAPLSAMAYTQPPMRFGGWRTLLAYLSGGITACALSTTSINWSCGFFERSDKPPAAVPEFSPSP